MLKRALFFTFLSTAVIGLFSCNGGTMYKKYISLPDNVWDVKNPVSFTVPVKDTLNYYNVYVNVRNADSYSFSNIYLFIDITSPAHKSERDTFECTLADPISGKWLGEGLGDIWDNKILFKQGVRFPQSGDYTFTFTQAMRVDKLPMIMDMGLTIEQAKTQTNSH